MIHIFFFNFSEFIMVISPSQSQHDIAARFCPLLQPIRDLTKNWDVDVAKNLEDYLEEVNVHNNI